MGEARQGRGRAAGGAWAGLVAVAGLVLLLAMVSYDWADIAALQSPPNSPPRNLIGALGAWASYLLFSSLGLAAFLVPVWFLAAGGLLLGERRLRIAARLPWFALLTLGVTVLLELADSVPWVAALSGGLNLGNAAGGFFAQWLTRGVLVRFLNPLGTLIVAAAVIAVSLTEIVGAAAWVGLWRAVRAGFPAAVRRMREGWERRRDAAESRAAERETARRRREEEDDAEYARLKPKPARAAVAVPREVKQPPAAPAARLPPPPPPAPPPDEEPEPPLPAPPPKRAAAPRPAPRSPAPVAAAAAAAAEPAAAAGNYALPPLDLLNKLPPARDRAVKADTTATGTILQQTLQEFGISTEIENVEQGPVVTRYELRPAAGVRVEKISSLSNNLALALRATSVRVQAPVPGKGVVGIEVPNTTTGVVFLREVLEGEVWRGSRAELPLVLGKDVAGNDLVIDLAQAPHLLVAGATGSGKTVCINSILAGLLMRKSPEELRLMLIDPKIVEFSGYEGLPHLVAPVLTEAKKVPLGLRWAINEMDRRYRMFARARVRNLTGFNSRPVVEQQELFAAPEGDGEGEKDAKDALPRKLPYIVIVIDELADLMLVAQADIENSIARLAQLSRAVGIHMILATQRPSVNVITGTIKANFPVRVAFQVAQRVDSRTILDSGGAEKLLGRGDMIFVPPGTAKPVRAQGALITDEELRRVVDYIKSERPANYEMAIQTKLENQSAEGPEDDGEEDEELIQAAIGVLRETHRASTSSLQRRLRIGYNRAARVMDLLETRGVVGPPCGADPREILIDLSGETPQNAVETEAGDQQA